ncbi:MAG TPA: DUF4010 domain-containing protein [Phycisphaerales bacterium]|nr:DUF4010 domain-containing protein [Phycisphaerales bacterium]
MTIPEPFLGLAVALGLGLLVGLQRQHAGSAVAGVRTFAIITLLGAGAGLLQPIAGAWAIGAGLLSVAALAWVGNASGSKEDRPRGMTTEAAMLLMFVVGVLVTVGQRPAAAVIGALCAVLLHMKDRLHRVARWLTDDDLRAIMQFAAVTLIILPILPDRDMGPFGALNPRHIWLLVVLVVGISLAAYLVHRVVGGNRGTLAAGLLGGLISSTATTAAFSRSARANASSAAGAAAAIAAASAVLYPRVAAELAVVAPGIWVRLVWPLGIMLTLSAVLCALVLLRSRRERTALEHVSNPSQLKSALFFAAMFAAVTLAAAASAHYWGSRGTLLVAALSGLTDLDAITLTVGEQAATGTVTPAYASAAILIAVVSNTLFKLGIVCVIGGRELVRHVWWYMAATAAAAAGLAAWLLAAE